MYTLLIILIVIAAFLMIGIVLIQESKGGGLASNFSGANQVVGVRKTTDIVEKATWGLAIAMVVVSVACAYVVPKAATQESVIEQASTESAASNANNVQGFGASEKKGGDAKATPAATQEQAPAAAQEQAPAEKK